MKRYNHTQPFRFEEAFAYVVQHFNPPACDEQTIVCDLAPSLDDKVDLVLRSVAAKALRN